MCGTVLETIGHSLRVVERWSHRNFFSPGFSIFVLPVTGGLLEVFLLRRSASHQHAREQKDVRSLRVPSDITSSRTLMEAGVSRD